MHPTLTPKDSTGIKQIKRVGCAYRNMINYQR
jgi:hypothetical protein